MAAICYLVSISVTSTDAQPNLGKRVLEIEQHLSDELTKNHNFTCLHKFKVLGEALLIAIFNVPCPATVTFDQLMGSFPIGVTITCELLNSYYEKESFAEYLRTTRDPERTSVSPLIWIQYTLNVKGGFNRTSGRLMKHDPVTKLYKVVGLPKMHAFVAMELKDWDKFSFDEIDSVLNNLTTVIKMATTF